MMRLPISLFTACAPWLPLDELAPLAAAAGITGLDLACKPHAFDTARAPSFWENNAAVLDLDRVELLAPAAARVLADWKLGCPVLAGYAPCTDLAAARLLARTAHIVSAPRVRLWVPRPEPGRVDAQIAGLRAVWRELAAIAAGEGIQFVFETHDATLATGASAAMRLIDGLDPHHVGVILDPANTVREGSEPLALAVELLGAHLAHVHVKDLWLRGGGTGWDGHTYGFAPLGDGILRWPSILGILRRSGYRGWVAIENFTGLDRGPARVATDVEWLRTQMEAAGP